MRFDGTVYYRQRGVLVLAPSFVALPNDRTFRRDSIRFLLGCTHPFLVEFANGVTLQTRAALIAPWSGCCRIVGENADIALFDFAKASPEYQATESLLVEKPFLAARVDDYLAWLPTLIEGQGGTLTPIDVNRLITDIVETLTGIPLQALSVDHRITHTLQQIETLSLSEITLKSLAPAVNLSKERFRHLFKESTGVNVSTYARQMAVWRALEMIEKDISITEASHAAGFYDVSHFYRAYVDFFGVNLCEKNNRRKFRRVRYFE